MCVYIYIYINFIRLSVIKQLLYVLILYSKNQNYKTFQKLLEIDTTLNFLIIERKIQTS